ncbi:hypothetical protein Bca52824_053129 [Brassica carinata]|uniref:Uncharacterized protein n=1 Tax=Brassica carinata TaxID=52824 RepID=A0A8X7UKL7_BRACI|nr:hypothetical protein Bca52824_053129 [Brassica carinata]
MAVHVISLETIASTSLEPLDSLKCWSTMIGALLGFTPQQGDVLQGYSDDDKDSDHKNGDEHVLASSPQPLSLKFKPSNVVNP